MVDHPAPGRPAPPYALFCPAGAMMGAAMGSALMALISWIGWTTIVMPILGFLGGGVAGAIIGAGLAVTSRSVNQATGMAVIFGLLGAIGGVTISITNIREGYFSAWNPPMRPAAIWGGAIGTIPGIFAGVVYARRHMRVTGLRNREKRRIEEHRLLNAAETKNHGLPAAIDVIGQVGSTRIEGDGGKRRREKGQTRLKKRRDQRETNTDA